jgi:hypothetical protein
MSRSARAAMVPLLVICAAQPAAAQRLVWTTRTTLYGDNTEFFTPYRVGETILGGQFLSALGLRTGPRTGVDLGVFGDHRSGSDDVLDPVKPIISFHYHRGDTTAVLGAITPERRHGYLEPLEVTTLEITRPIEYGLAWIGRWRRFDGEVHLDWQKLNLPGQREAFDYGWVLRLRPVRFVSLEHQLHGLHHGGQLYDAGVPVTNNTAWGLGAALADSLRWAGRSSLALWRLWSAGNIDPAAPADRPRSGRGWYLRAAVTPRGWVELFSISWWGRNFLSQDGDNNYNSVGADPAFYRAERRYWELGLLRRSRIESDVTLDAEWRFHRIDDLPSIAIGHSKWEYSYRLVVRAPFELVLKG